jgi:hypothetical protein
MTLSSMSTRALPVDRCPIARGAPPRVYAGRGCSDDGAGR